MLKKLIYKIRRKPYADRPLWLPAGYNFEVFGQVGRVIWCRISHERTGEVIIQARDTADQAVDAVRKLYEDKR